MVMQIRGVNCYPGREKRVKIPLLPENVPFELSKTLERVTTGICTLKTSFFLILAPSKALFIILRPANDFTLSEPPYLKFITKLELVEPQKFVPQVLKPIAYRSY